MEFIETPAFTRNLPAYMTDEEYRLFQRFLMENPDAGDVIPDTGGIRKVRWADPRRGKGKRGGLRVIYFHLVAASHLWLLTLYDKDEAADLTPKQKKAFHRLVQEIEAAWAKTRKQTKR